MKKTLTKIIIFNHNRYIYNKLNKKCENKKLKT